MSPINQAEALLSSIEHKSVDQALVILMGAANPHVIAGISATFSLYLVARTGRQ